MRISKEPNGQQFRLLININKLFKSSMESDNLLAIELSSALEGKYLEFFLWYTLVSKSSKFWKWKIQIESKHSTFIINN